jgi:hypothetical protein
LLLSLLEGSIGGGIAELCETESGIREDVSEFRELSWHLWWFKTIYVGDSLFENNLSGCIVPPKDHDTSTPHGPGIAPI